jgi:D-beta-D-heptose 7-phosphate kinase/D-beta-D-heptose 1-phosphate adenosyltransferase
VIQKVELSQSRIAVVGDLMVDEYLWGRVERISAEAPVPILNVVRRESTLGGAGNVVKNLRSLGVSTAGIGVVGEDGAGQEIVEMLDVLGADSTGVVTDPHRTSTRKTRLMSIEHGQQVFRLDEESARWIAGHVEQQVIDGIRAAARGVDLILCSDYLKGVATERVLQAIFGAAREHGICSIVAPKDSKPEKYRGARILMLNEKELARLTGTRVDGNDWLTDSTRRLTKDLELKALVVTRGSQGMALFEPGRTGLRRVDIPAVAKSVYDVTGAGDTALATFAAAMASGSDHEAAVRMANVAAGIVVGKRGTATATIDEIREHNEEPRHCPSPSRKALPSATASIEQ